MATGHGTFGRAYLAAAHETGIPQRIVYFKCLRWGVTTAIASDISEDSSSEAILRSIDRSFHDFEHFSAWTTRVASNLAVDALRRMRRHRSLEGCALFSVQDRSPTEFTTDVVERAISELSEEEVRIVRVSAIEGLTLDELADTLMVSGGTLNARRLRAKRMRDKVFTKLGDKLRRLGVD